MTHEIYVTVDNQIYSGSYYIERGVLHVTSNYGSQATHPGSAPASIARMMLRELVQAHLEIEQLEKSKNPSANEGK